MPIKHRVPVHGWFIRQGDGDDESPNGGAILIMQTKERPWYARIAGGNRGGVSVREAAALCNVRRATIYKWISTGLLNALPVKKPMNAVIGQETDALMIRLSELHAFAKKHPTVTVTEGPNWPGIPTRVPHPDSLDEEPLA